MKVPDFIFVFLDDSSLDVVDPSTNLNGAYEGVDVENGAYAFFDSQIRTMLPRFITPNREGRTLGVGWVASGSYILEASGDGHDDFIDRLSRVSVVNPNPWFETVEQVTEYARTCPRV
jgi:hypothetical protein